MSTQSDYEDVAEDAAARRARMQKRVLTGVGFVVALLLGVGVYVSRGPTASNVLLRSRADINAAKARYCRVRADIDAHPSRPVQPLRLEHALQLPPYIDFTGQLPSIRRDSNADAIMGTTLARLCGRSVAGNAPEVFSSIVERVSISPSESVVESYDGHAVADALDIMRATRYLLVFDVESSSQTTMLDAHTFSGGAISGTVWLYSLQDVSYLGAVDVAASGDALRRTVAVSQWSSSSQQQRESESALRRADADAYRSVVRRALQERGVRLSYE